MDIFAQLKALAHQKNPGIKTDGSILELRGTRVGQLFTADFKAELALAGLLYRIKVGDITGGGDVAPVTGGGAGTIVDQNQPEVAVGVDLGYYLVPISIRVSTHIDMDANAEDADIIVAVDRTAEGQFRLKNQW